MEKEYAIDLYHKALVVMLDIPQECKDNFDFSDAMRVGESCKDCEYRRSEPEYPFGGMTGMSMGDKYYCEKGYWEDDI